MKAKAVLFMLLMIVISYTGFATSHSDPGQNSNIEYSSISGDVLSQMSDVGCPMTDVRSEVTVIGVVVIDVGSQMSDVGCPVSDVGGLMQVIRYNPPDTIQLSGQPFIYIKTDTLWHKRLLIDRYRWRQYELIKVRRLPEVIRLPKPRDKV